MRLKSACWIFAVIYFTAVFLSNLCAEEFPFFGQVNSDNINIRSDSTVTSRIICSVNRSERLEVVQQLYDWYKVKLPKFAPSFIRKDMIKCASNTCSTVEVIKERVNIRLKPDEASPIIGRANKNEILSIVGVKGDWYGIEPAQNSFGWIHKKFINRIPVVDN